MKTIKAVRKVEEMFARNSTKSDLTYHQLQYGISIEVLNLPKEGTREETMLTNHLIAINLTKYARMNCLSGNKHYEFSLYRGSLGVIPSQVPIHTWWDRNVQCLYIHVQPSFLSQCSEQLFQDNKTVELLPQLQPIQDPLIYQLGLAIKCEMEQNSSLFYLESMSNTLAAHLLHKYSNHTKPSPSYQGGLAPHQQKKVVELINDNLDQNISLTQMATVVDLSRSHFSHAFKQSMGISPHRYIIQQRVKRAKQLLLQDKMTIAEVATACGFNHQSHLDRHFKSLTGLTPVNFCKQ